MVETNRYAGLGLPRQQHARAWDDVTVDDMKTFVHVGLLILMRVLWLPRIEMYRSNDCEFPCDSWSLFVDGLK